jgi:hypothetical protein
MEVPISSRNVSNYYVAWCHIPKDRLMTNAALNVIQRAMPPFTLQLSFIPCPPVSHVAIYTTADKSVYTAAAGVVVLILPASDKDRMKY